MPRIELIPEVFYNPQDPIHWEIDNLPLKAIIRRQNLINLALDNVIEQMRDAIGTQGSLSNRLNQSLKPDGGLKTDAVDGAMHSIESHTDSDMYVRMTREESEKLAHVAEEATNTSFEIYTDETTFVEFSQGVLRIKPSTTVTPSFESPDVLKLNLSFPTSAAHEHYYGLVPIDANQVSPDFKNYKVTATDPVTSFVNGSLRVYVNGVRIFEDAEVYVPGPLVDDAWTLLSFTSNHSDGTFELSSALSPEDMIRIDFDKALIS
jgi:hypothetical protein